MATDVNRAYVMGRLTRDPEARKLSSGATVGTLSLAINESYRNRDGETVEKTSFVDVSVWNRQAEVCETYLQKGSQVLVEGRLAMDEWTDKEGTERKKLALRADRVHFLSWDDKKGSGQGRGKKSREREPAMA